MNILLFTGIILSIAWLIIASFNRITVLLSAPIAAVIVMGFGGADFLDGFFGSSGSYIVYLADFVKDFFFIFILGSIMAKYLQLSGAIESISNLAAKVVDQNNPMHGMVTVFLITSLLTYGGVSLFVVMFATVPLARSLFHRMHIPWKLAPLPIVLGLGTFTAGTLPGSPSVINVIPSKTLGTNLMAAPFMGIVASTSMVLVSVLYMKWAIKRQGQSAEEIHEEEGVKQHENGPGIVKSLLPIFLLIGIIIIGSAFDIPEILTIALVIVVLSEMILFHPHLSSHIYVLNTGTTDALLPLLSTASTIAYGSYIANNKVVSDLTRKLMTSFSNKLVMGSIVTIIFSVITASASGAIGIVMASQGQYLLGIGLDSEVIHRVLATASILLPNMPHSGVVIALLTLSELSHKEAFKHVFWGPSVVGLTGLIITLLMA